MNTEYVMVECVSMFRMRYCVKVPAGNAHWALDAVTLNEAEEFSQKHLDEVISSHRVVSEEEVCQIFKEDHDYLKHVITNERILERYVLDATKD